MTATDLIRLATELAECGGVHRFNNLVAAASHVLLEHERALDDRVLRLAEKDPVVVFDGSGGEYLALVARLLELDDEITQQDIDDVRASSDVLRKLAGSLTLREARAYLDETCIKIEVEKAGLTESAA